MTQPQDLSRISKEDRAGVLTAASARPCEEQEMSTDQLQWAQAKALSRVHTGKAGLWGEPGSGRGREHQSFAACQECNPHPHLKH